jgi:hypothetical protein
MNCNPTLLRACCVAWLIGGEQDQSNSDPHGWSDAFMFTIDQRLPRLEVLNMNHRAWVCIPRFLAEVRSIGVVCARMHAVHTRHHTTRPTECVTTVWLELNSTIDINTHAQDRPRRQGLRLILPYYWLRGERPSYVVPSGTYVVHDGSQYFHSLAGAGRAPRDQAPLSGRMPATLPRTTPLQQHHRLTHTHAPRQRA